MSSLVATWTSGWRRLLWSTSGGSSWTWDSMWRLGSSSSADSGLQRANATGSRLSYSLWTLKKNLFVCSIFGESTLLVSNFAAIETTAALSHVKLTVTIYKMCAEKNMPFLRLLYEVSYQPIINKRTIRNKSLLSCPVKSSIFFNSVLIRGRKRNNCKIHMNKICIPRYH